MGDAKSFWKMVNNILPNRKKVKQSFSTIIDNGCVLNEKSTIAEAFNRFFALIVKNITSQVNTTPSTCSTQSPYTENVFQLNQVNNRFVLNQLLKLKINKGTGLDSIPARLLKDGAYEISECITYIINMSLTQGIVPEDWKYARVIPVYKSGKNTDMDNYSPMSILPAVSKIAEKVVYHQLYQYLAENQLLSPYQSGFRKDFSTETAVTFRGQYS